MEPGFGTPPPWMEDAACIGQFPQWDEDGGRRAKTVCASCPVRLSCLGFALEQERGLPAKYRQGIWGGLDVDERMSIVIARGERIMPQNGDHALEPGQLTCIRCGGPVSYDKQKKQVRLYCTNCRPHRGQTMAPRERKAA